MRRVLAIFLGLLLLGIGTDAWPQADRDRVTDLIEKLTDARPHVRWSAATTLGKLGDKRAVETLTGKQTSPRTPQHEKYLRKIVEAAKYNQLAARLHQNVHIPKHDPKEMEAVFDRHEVEILRPLVPYLKGFAGSEYAALEVSVHGKPMKAEADKPERICFYVRVSRAMPPWSQKGTRLRDAWGSAVLWDRNARCVSDVIHPTSCILRAVPPDALTKARKIAAKHDKLYASRRVADCRWLPAWHVEKMLDAPKGKRTEGFIEGEWVIREKTGHDLVMLHYEAEILSKSRSTCTVLFHWVFIDVQLGRVLGVYEYEAKVRTGPIFGK